jgi:hypothetical protein
MFHKYDFGTASQITTRRWAAMPIEPEAPSRAPLAIAVVLVEVAAIAALLFVPNVSKLKALAFHHGKQSEQHKVAEHKFSEHRFTEHKLNERGYREHANEQNVTEHLHHASKHIG